MDEQLLNDADGLTPANTTAEVLLNAYQQAVEEDNTEQAEHNALLFIAHASDEMKRKPSPELLLMQEAHRSEANGEWLRAEEIYQQLLAVAIAEGNVMAEFKANDNLSALYSFLGQTERVLVTASAAMEAARRSGIEVLLGMALENQARYNLKAGNLPQAFTLAEEMLAMLPSTKMNALQRARALVLRTSCNINAGDLVSAQADLDAAKTLFGSLSAMPMFAGVQSGMAALWQATARLYSAQGHHMHAAQAWSTSVEYRRVVSQQPHLDGPYKFAWLAQALHHYSEALLAANDTMAADDALKESRAIMRSIHHPDTTSGD